MNKNDKKTTKKFIKNGGTVAVSLPKSWVEGLGLEGVKGEKVEIERVKDCIIIRKDTQ
jgi:antitoxin component of MazEF toxin-antitoxin module